MKELFRFFLMELPIKLKSLHADAPRQFGEMTVEQMLDHLRKAYEMSYSGQHMDLDIDPELVDRAQAFLKSDKEIRPGAKAPAFFAEMESNDKDIEEMKLALLREMVGMLAFFDKHPKYSQVHPRFGLLNIELWLRLHKKHTEHHLRQFGLL